MWAVIAALVFVQAPDYTSEGLKSLDEGKYEAAAQQFAKAVAADAKDYFAHFNLALAYGMLHRDAEAMAEYRTTLELKPNLYEAELNAGILYMRQKDPVEALALFEAAAEQKPDERKVREYLAEAQLQSGALDKAAESYRGLIAMDPKAAGAELGLAHALARQGNLAEAAPHFQRAAALDPNDRRYLLELAGLYEQAGQAGEASAIYREFPENAAAQARLNELMMQDRKYAEAIPGLEAAFTKDGSEANRAALAAAYVFTGKQEKALPLLKDATAAEPANYDLRLMYAHALRDGKQYGPAAAQFLEAAKIRPQEAKTWNDLGGMLYLMGQLPQSLEAFERARQLGDQTPGNWFLRAIILDKLKQLKPAMEAYQQFLAMSQGKNPDQEFQARQRSRIIKRELDKR